MTGLNGDRFATKIDAVSVTKSTGPLNYSFYFRWKHHQGRPNSLVAVFRIAERAIASLPKFRLKIQA